MSKPQEPSYILRRVATVIRSSSSMNSHRTSGDGKPNFATFPAATVASPTMLEAIHPVMSPKMHRVSLGVRGGDIAAVMRGLKIERAHLVGLSMGGYAALQFGLRYPEKTSAIVAASVGSGSHPSQRDAWLRETSVLARIFIEHGMVSMAERMARGPARIQLKYKDQKNWREFVVRLRQHSALGMSNTMARCQALRPSLHDLHDQFLEMKVPVLLAVGDEDVRCLETNLMLKSDSSQRGPLDLSQYRPRDQSGRANGIQCADRKFPKRRRTWQLASRISGNAGCPSTSDAVDMRVATIRPSKSIPKQPMPAWFVCTTNDGPRSRSHSRVSFMKPRVGVYLSEGMAARLAEAAKSPRATKSALVEAALDRFLGSDDDIGDTATVAHHLAGLSRQLEELDRNLRIANETAALHARFHLAVTPLLPASGAGGRMRARGRAI